MVGDLFLQSLEGESMRKDTRVSLSYMCVRIFIPSSSIFASTHQICLASLLMAPEERLQTNKPMHNFV